MTIQTREVAFGVVGESGVPEGVGVDCAKRVARVVDAIVGGGGRDRGCCVESWDGGKGIEELCGGEYSGWEHECSEDD